MVLAQFQISRVECWLLVRLDKPAKTMRFARAYPMVPAQVLAAAERVLIIVVIPALIITLVIAYAMPTILAEVLLAIAQDQGLSVLRRLVAVHRVIAVVPPILIVQLLMPAAFVVVMALWVASLAAQQLPHAVVRRGLATGVR